MEYWLAFRTVVDTGSFAQAADVLNKSQSSVSYAVGRLQDLLPTPVLRIEGRRAVLTAEGEVLYRYARQLIDHARLTEDVAQALSVEFESEVVIALDVLLKIDALCGTLDAFSQRFPHTRVRVLETSLSGTVEALLEQRADIVLGSTVPVGHQGHTLRPVQMIPVVAPHHPLATIGEVSEAQLRTDRQVVLRDSGQKSQQDAGWLQAERRWTVSHFSSSISLVKAGLGFAFLPRNWIATELAEGSLVELSMAGEMRRTLPIYLMVARPDTAGPATREMATLLRSALG